MAERQDDPPDRTVRRELFALCPPVAYGFLDEAGTLCFFPPPTLQCKESIILDAFEQRSKKDHDAHRNAISYD